MKFNHLEEFLTEIMEMERDCKRYIWGISVYGDLLGRLFNKYKVMWDGYFDNFSSTEDETLNSKPVYKGDSVNVFEKAKYILPMRDCEAVKVQLMEKGVNEDSILCLDNADILDDFEDFMGESSVSKDKIKSFRNMHYGEKCFIIGNGPSLNIQDLDVIYRSGIVSFASNLIFKCYDKTLWRPEYYFFIDVTGIREELGSNTVLNYVTQNCKYMFVRSNGNLNENSCEKRNIVCLKFVFSKFEHEFDFSTDCSEKIYIGYMVTYAMLQMAVYMGFKEIYLLGMDHNFSREKQGDGSIATKENVRNHAAILGNYGLWGVAEPVKTTNAYKSAKNYADGHGIKIYNATRGGKLEVFERVDFDGLFS